MYPTRDTPAKLRGVSEKQRSRPLVNSVKSYSITSSTGRNYAISY